MKYRLELYRPVSTVTDFDDGAAGWESCGWAHAERVKMRGSRSMEADEGFADYAVEYNIRDAHGVDEGWRVRQYGGHLYDVTNVIPNIDRGMLTLCCARVNE